MGMQKSPFLFRLAGEAHVPVGMDSASLHNRLSFPESALTFSQLANLPFNCGGEPFTTQAVPESLFAEHPEYFTLIGGRRVPGKYPARRCYSNPDVIQLCVRLGIAFSDYGGEVALSMTDTPGGWCECDACRAYGQDADGVWPGENYAHRFVGDVAAGILAARRGDGRDGGEGRLLRPHVPAGRPAVTRVGHAFRRLRAQESKRNTGA